LAAVWPASATLPAFSLTASPVPFDCSAARRVACDRVLDAEERVRLAVPPLFGFEFDDFERVLRDDEDDLGFVELPPERRFVGALSGDITLLPTRVSPRPQEACYPTRFPRTPGVYEGSLKWVRGSRAGGPDAARLRSGVSRRSA
jgi:hypothetical protein